MVTTRARTRAKPPSQRRTRRAPVPRRGWQHHKVPRPAKRRGLTAATKQIRRTTTRMRSSHRRINKRKGAIWSIVALGVAATAFSFAVTGVVSDIAAAEFGLATQGVFIIGDWVRRDVQKPAGQSKIKNTAAAMKAHAALCGAPTVDGTPCKNRGRCPHHGGSAARVRMAAGKSTASSGTPRRGASTPKQTTAQLNQGVPGTKRRAKQTRTQRAGINTNPGGRIP
jgi:hypothetical protein